MAISGRMRLWASYWLDVDNPSAWPKQLTDIVFTLAAVAWCLG
jgi:hypothetical protein